MDYIFRVLLLLLISPVAWSCTCWRTEPIEGAIASEPILVEGRVVSLEQTDDPRFGKLTHSATLRVEKVLKGSVSPREITVVHTMCYATVVPDNMEIGHTYVLPLALPAPEPPVSEDNTVTVVVGPKPGEYEMAACADSGLERVGGRLFKYNHGTDRQLRREPYMPYAVFRVWWPVAQGVLLSFAFLWGMHSQFGAAFLVFWLVVGTAGAYFAAKHRPWLLIPVVLLVIVLLAFNLGELQMRSVFISKHGPFYWAFSWSIPAMILVAAAFGYRMRRRLT